MIKLIKIYVWGSWSDRVVYLEIKVSIYILKLYVYSLYIKKDVWDGRILLIGK